MLAPRASRGWEIFFSASASFYPSELSGIISFFFEMMILDYSENYSEISWLFSRWEKKLIKVVDHTFHVSRTVRAQATWQEGP